MTVVRNILLYIVFVKCNRLKFKHDNMSFIRTAIIRNHYLLLPGSAITRYYPDLLLPGSTIIR